jgi:hypothetical protein
MASWSAPISSRNDTIRRARRALRSLERQRIAQKRLTAQRSRLGTHPIDFPELDLLHLSVQARLTALQHERHSDARLARIADMGRLLARVEHGVGS